MSAQKIPLIVILGPTASGKTSLSIEVAKRYNGEIVSADSMQIYKYMDIGTAKPSMEGREGIKHHMLDVAAPDEEFSVYSYAEKAKKCIEQIYNSGSLPIMVGGTGLYIDNVLQNISLAEQKDKSEWREKLTLEAQKYGNEYMHKKLAEIDVQAAKNIHPNNIRRVIRALEVYYETGKTFSEQLENSKNDPSPYESIIFMPMWERETLYERIDKRVDIMFDDGLMDEFVSLAKMGYSHKLNSMQAIGYKELFAYYRGLSSLDDAKELIKKHSRNYAKRQLTWFKRNKDIILLDAQNKDIKEECVDCISEWLKGRQI
ncbi:MAG: tRNA (adenosine(37)-N6)-dimethylallyltransferase MiaA [Ruminococcaceae bacterium]|nr:tRNA (adenosine(37)-N6)-dimethylallyltransferase MiaA [Oscillospiraceae bacterium]